MHEWTGFIKINLTEEQEVMLTLALDPHDYNRASDPEKRYTVIQNAFFHLGALEATKTITPQGVQYLSIFTTYFPRQEKYYRELYEFLQTIQSPFTAYFKPHGRSKDSTHIHYSPNSNEIISLDTIPDDYNSEFDARIQALREWITISDMYIHIPPPTSSIFKSVSQINL
jgi:hypothetical protein